jgi:DNA-binding LacI/PurR family transcriptional regulator
MKAPLYEQLYAHILAEIEAGRLHPGNRVPSEKELAAQFHVSRITSKRALEKLAQDGIIVRARGRGSFVRSGDHGAPAAGTAEDHANAHGPLPLVGFLVPDVSDTYGAHMLRVVEDELRQHGMRMVLCRTQGRRELEEQAIEDCLALGVVGLIIFPVYGEFYNERLLRLVLDHFPVVLVDRYLRGIPACSVCTDNLRAAEDLATYLIDQGHRRFAFVSPPPAGTSAIEERTLGVMAAMVAHGLAFDANADIVQALCTLPGAVTPTTPSANLVEQDLETLTAFARAHPDVTAYVTCEHPLAVLTLRALGRLGRQAPDDVSVACFDSSASPLDVSSITHMQQDEAAIGRQAVALLAMQLRGETVPLRTITGHTLVPGLTTGVAPVARGAATPRVETVS